MPAKNYANYNSISSVISMLPRFGIEAISFGGMLLLILYFMKLGSFLNILPLITLYAFAGYRVLPAAQAVYSAIVVSKYHQPALDTLYEDMKNLKVPNYNKDKLKLFPKKVLDLKILILIIQIPRKHL